MLDLSEARRRIERCVRASRQMRSWYQTVLNDPLPIRRVRIRLGEFGEQVAARATQLDARLIVLSPSMARLGSTATALARACLRPVLVARGAEPSGALVAATDLEDPQYRVVRQASEWGATLAAPVMAVHNVSCVAAPIGRFYKARPKPPPALPRRVRAELPAPLDMVVTTDLDPVDGVLDQALRHESRIIVVGTRPRRGPAPHHDHSVAAQIIDRSRCSVLVTSLEP
jgi:nucleotide-binding universal stress UspA family protein